MWGALRRPHPIKLAHPKQLENLPGRDRLEPHDKFPLQPPSTQRTTTPETVIQRDDRWIAALDDRNSLCHPAPRPRLDTHTMALNAQTGRLGRLALSSPRPLAPAPSTARSISCTAQRSSLPPQAPDFIPVPTPPLSEEKRPSRVRGSLPVPRKVFPQAADARKADAAYVDKAYPHPKKKPAPETLDPDHPAAWKRLMAENRRTNLRSGLQELWGRKQRKERRAAKAVAEKQREHVKAGRAPERLDEFLTRSTILEQSIQTEVLPDPLRFERAEAGRQAVARREQEKKDARRDALMELYMNARSFIVTEQQLEEEVESVFSENYWRDPARDSAWEQWGTQSGIYDMVGRVVRDSPTNAMEKYTADYSRNMKRQKRTAEELTGGKMSDRDV